jgi:hypothetical protein
MRGFVFKALWVSCLILFFSGAVIAHEGAHGNDECLMTVGNVELRLNGYQFKGRNPDKHYCRHYPHLGQTIIKVDSTTTDLTGVGVELILLKRNSWKGLILNKDDAFSVIKQLPIQYFSKQVVSIESDIQSRDIYAIKLRLHATDGEVTEQQFAFFVGVPFVQVLVGIAILLLIVISVIFLQQLRKA